MSEVKARSRKNLEYAKRWLDRAMKDFEAFKGLVPFDRKTRRSVRCPDPALAVYLLQQSVEKAVKAAAIASGQYKTNDFTTYYKHNSLALILNLNQKIITKIEQLGLKPVAELMGVDLLNGTLKLINIENQVMGKPNSIVKSGKRVDFREESIRVSPEVMDKILDLLDVIRSSFLNAIRSTFRHLPEMGMRKGHGTVDDPETFVRQLSGELTRDLKVRPPSEAQLQALIEFVRLLSSFNMRETVELKRSETTANCLGVWALSTALLFLTYFTFAHESTSRYPQRVKKSNTAKTAKIGCDDYNDSLSIVNRLGRVGYATVLTLNDMKQELEAIAFFFAAKPVTFPHTSEVGNH